MNEQLLQLLTQAIKVLQADESGEWGKMFTAAIKLSPADTDIEVAGKRYPKGEILMFKNVAVAKVETNANGDVIDEQNAQDLATSLALKPISIEHEDGKMAGVIVSAAYQAPFTKVDGIIYVKHTPQEVVDGLSQGKKSLSVEASAEKAICSICGHEFANQDDYCSHLQAKRKSGATRKLVNLRGTGASIVSDPAGSGTSITSNAVTLIAYQEVAAREFSAEQREKLAKSGAALPDGSYPIESEEDLQNAIHAIGRASDPAKAKAHIIARAKSLGKESMLPEDWVHGMQELLAEVQSNILKKVEDLTKAVAEVAKTQPQLSAKVEALNGEVLAARTYARKVRLVESGILTEEEFEANKEALVAAADSVLTLLASKKPKLRVGGVPDNLISPPAKKVELVL